MISKLYEASSPDGHRLRLDRIDGVLSLVVHDGDDAAAIALSMQQSAQLSDALAGDLKERVRRVLHAIDEIRNPLLQNELREAMRRHLANAPTGPLLGVVEVRRG
jgi:hypothetical protein